MRRLPYLLLALAMLTYIAIAVWKGWLLIPSL